MLKPYPPFSRGYFLSGVDTGVEGLIRARSGLGSDGEKSGDLNRFTNDFSGSLETTSQNPRSGQIMGDFPGYASLKIDGSSSILQASSSPSAISCVAGETLGVEGSRGILPEAWRFLPC